MYRMEIIIEPTFAYKILGFRQPSLALFSIARVIGFASIGNLKPLMVAGCSVLYGFSSLADNHRQHAYRGNWIGPPPTEKRI